LAVVETVTVGAVTVTVAVGAATVAVVFVVVYAWTTARSASARMVFI